MAIQLLVQKSFKVKSIKDLLHLIKNLPHEYRSNLRAMNETSGADWVRVSAGPLHGHKLFIAPESPADWNREMMEGVYDSFFFDALKKLGWIESCTIWDVGAHIGYHSLAFAALVGPEGQIVAFEPNPYNRERFQMNLKRNQDLAKRISLFDCALTDSNGKVAFKFSAEVDNGQSSGSHLSSAVLPESEKFYQSFKHCRVQAITADTLIRKDLAPSPSVIKIDVEGAEFAVLKGSSNLLATKKPLLFIEIHNIFMMFKVQQFLYRFGYELSMLQTKHDSFSRGFFMAQHPDQKKN